MSEAFSNSEMTADERAYMEGGGVMPPTSEEPTNPKPGDKSEPEAEPEKKADEPEPDDEDDVQETEPDANGKRKRVVNYGAFVKQKKDAAEARRQLEEYRQQLSQKDREFADFRGRAEERLGAYQRHLQAQQAPQQQPQPEQPKTLPPPPDRMQDPLAYMEWQDQRAAMLEDRLNGLDQSYQQSAAQQRQAAQIAELDRRYRADNAAAAREMPAYSQAYNYLVGMRERELTAQYGGRIPKAQIDQQIENEERQLADHAFRMGKRPAQLVLEMAHIRGFRVPEAAPQAPIVDPTAEQARIDAQNRGQERNRSLSTTGRPANGNVSPSVDKLLSMSDAEFTKYMAENPGALERMQGVA